MGTAKTKGEWLRIKRARQSIDLAPTPKREKSGRPTRKGQARTPDIETLKARCIQMGKSINPANLREMRAPWWGCYAGRVIGSEIMSDDERRDLWTAINHMRRVVTAHDAALGLPRRHAVCLRLLAPVDEMTTNADAPAPDYRTDEEKQRKATAELMTMEGWLGYTDKRAMGEAKRVILRDEGCVDPEGLLLALRCISDGIKGRRMVYRGRDA
ncbi:hypothetical protein RM190_04880 [Paracoccus sp. CPCC 101403]|uniref:Uncharacterized protein n=1 Tax=Paracoccus broussonetiae TaxID=3075834 RepID=A0ABU3EAC9_9RHOB|nr:hypothetical protein [Paracoccus sp. CPCC 101403]MDT1061183.1 hypothetical protein [Paracoccus sp. CPCC 101403]